MPGLYTPPKLPQSIAWMAAPTNKFPRQTRFYVERRRGLPCESDCCALIDAFLESVYIRTMPVGKIQVGQVWKKDDSGESYLITKIYNEAIATFALLRKTGAEAEGTIKIKVDQRGPSQALPGFTYTQESDHF